jgi:hypothetical protein
VGLGQTVFKCSDCRHEYRKNGKHVPFDLKIFGTKRDEVTREVEKTALRGAL